MAKQCLNTLLLLGNSQSQFGANGAAKEAKRPSKTRLQLIQQLPNIRDHFAHFIATALTTGAAMAANIHRNQVESLIAHTRQQFTVELTISAYARKEYNGGCFRTELIKLTVERQFSKLDSFATFKIRHQTKTGEHSLTEPVLFYRLPCIRHQPFLRLPGFRPEHQGFNLANIQSPYTRFRKSTTKFWPNWNSIMDGLARLRILDGNEPFQGSTLIDKALFEEIQQHLLHRLCRGEAAGIES